MKKQTFRFYTYSGLYKGWAYLTREAYYNEIVGWLRSGNTIMIKYIRYDVLKLASIIKLIK